MLHLLLLLSSAHSDAAVPVDTCSNVAEGVCLNAAKPILRTIENTTDVGACCAACVAMPTCVSWNVNRDMKECFLRASYIPNEGTQCTSGRVRAPPPPPPPPPPSDQRPRFHLMPQEFFTNDVQGPFYDPKHGYYHMGFAWHVNGTAGIKSAPNRWYHAVSTDLAKWTVVSTTPDRAMLKPDEPYDNGAVMTGSVTLVDGNPIALYSSRGSATAETGTVICAAAPANRSDPMLVDWVKSDKNPLIQHPAKLHNGGFRDPSTAWRSGDYWYTVIACGDCATTNSSQAALYRSPASDSSLTSWEPAGALYEFSTMIECPDFFPVSDGLYALKYNRKAVEFAIVGKYDEEKQKLVPEGSDTEQLLDAGPVYASKSFYDPVNKQQVWMAWVKEAWKQDNSCVNASVCGTHTLLRTVEYDRDLGILLLQPAPQLKKLRGPKPVVSLGPNLIKAGDALKLDASGMQLEIVASFAVPSAADGTYSFGVATRLSSDGLQRTDCALSGTLGRDGPALELQIVVNNTAGILPTKRTNSAPVPLKDGEARVELRCFVDHSVVEAYAQGGRAAITQRSYPTDDANALAVFAMGVDVQLESLDVYEMDSLWLN